VYAGLGQQHAWLAVVEHEGQPLGRVGRVERHIGGTGLERGQQGHHHVDAALQAQGHTLVGPQPQADEVVGQAVGARVQLGVAERGGLEDEGGGLGRAGGLLLEEGVDQGLRQRRDGGVEAVQHLLTLLGRQHGQGVQRGLGILF
jgi:hypothetical protein